MHVYKELYMIIYSPLSLQEIFSPVSQCLVVMNSDIFYVLHTAVVNEVSYGLDMKCSMARSKD